MQARTTILLLWRCEAELLRRAHVDCHALYATGTAVRFLGAVTTNSALHFNCD
jgi:hypothetical protein